MSPQALSPKQMKLLEWIEAYVREKGYMPSRREMALGMGVSSVATIQQHVETLEAKGYLRLREHENRGIELGKRWEKAKLARTNPARAALERDRDRDASEERSVRVDADQIAVRVDADQISVPLLGRVAAGYPIEVFTAEESIRVPASMRSGRQLELFALRVQGNSMIGEGILDGDLIVCEKSATARSGETVVALLNGEATLKTLRKTRDRVELVPANPQYPVLLVQEGDSFQVQGVLTGVLRTYGARRT